MEKRMQLEIPSHVRKVLDRLKEENFEAYIVGGCVRDLLMDRTPKDWDVTTSALPEEIQTVFKKSLYNNAFGTVVVRSEEEEIEVTTFRAETSYSDKRHPDDVKFGVSLKEDLARRDFTMNALAYSGNAVVDEFGGMEDIKAKRIKAVGDPEERFEEDALRMIRAVRFAAQLGFTVEPKTWRAIKGNAKAINAVSNERIRDELMKILSTEDPWKGVWCLYKSFLLDHIIPELLEGVGMVQPRHHIYTVFNHNLFSLAFCPSKDRIIRLATLLHDVGKPRAAEGDDKTRTFHNHEVVGANMTRKIMKRLKFSKKEIERATHLVRQHMFFYSIGEITDAGVRRLLRRVGQENMDDLMDVRIGDRMGSGTQKEKPYKLVELEKRLIEVQKDPIDTRMLAIDGYYVMTTLSLKPGPKIGFVMQTLLNEILDDPNLNTEEYLSKRVLELKDEVEALTDKQANVKEKDLREQSQAYA